MPGSIEVVAYFVDIEGQQDEWLHAIECTVSYAPLPAGRPAGASRGTSIPCVCKPGMLAMVHLLHAYQVTCHFIMSLQSFILLDCGQGQIMARWKAAGNGY